MIRRVVIYLVFSMVVLISLSYQLVSGGQEEYAFLLSWPDGLGFRFPFDIAADSFGNVYVADTYNNRVVKLDSNGNLLTCWGTYGAGDSQFYSPRGIAVDASGNVYVADTGNGRIQKFDSNGKFLTQWSAWEWLPNLSVHSGARLVGFASGIAVDSFGNVYVADTDKHCIQKFDSEGNFLITWGTFGSNDGQFHTPNQYWQ